LTTEREGKETGEKANRLSEVEVVREDSKVSKVYKIFRILMG
jgi:hypothetical protein